jgi:hypothetical protein
VVDFFVVESAPRFDFGLERARSDDFDSNLSPVFDRRIDTFSKRIIDHSCLIYRADGKSVVSYFWISEPGSVVPLTPWLQLCVPDGYAYIWDCKTDESARGQGHYTNGLKEIVGSHPRCLIAVEGNPAARKAVERAGFTHSHTVDTRNLGPVTLVDRRIVATGATLLVDLPTAGAKAR